MSGIGTSIMLPEVDATTPEGTRVIVRKDNGALLLTATRSDPWRLGHGQLVVSVYGISGGYAADRCYVLPTAPSTVALSAEHRAALQTNRDRLTALVERYKDRTGDARWTADYEDMQRAVAALGVLLDGAP